MDTEIKPTVPINGKLYFDLAGAASALLRSEHTIRREISRGRIRFLNYGRAKYFLQTTRNNIFFMFFAVFPINQWLRSVHY